MAGPPPLNKPIGKRTSIGLAWNDQEKVHVKQLKEIILEANKDKTRRGRIATAKKRDSIQSQRGPKAPKGRATQAR